MGILGVTHLTSKTWKRFKPILLLYASGYVIVMGRKHIHPGSVKWDNWQKTVSSYFSIIELFVQSFYACSWFIWTWQKSLAFVWCIIWLLFVGFHTPTVLTIMSVHLKMHVRWVFFHRFGIFFFVISLTIILKSVFMLKHFMDKLKSLKTKRFECYRKMSQQDL